MHVLPFLALNAGAVLVALRVAVATGAGARASRLVLAVLSGYLVLIHSLVLAAGLLGWLTAGGLAMLTAIAIAGALSLARAPRNAPDTASAESPVTPATAFASLVGTTAAVVWLWPHVFDATRLWIWDDYTYHMVYPALWLHDHAIAATTPPRAFTMQAWYPLSASVIATWFMAPFHGARADSLAWVSLTAPLYGGLVMSGAAELLARVGCRRGAWAVPVVLFATSDRITVMASSFSDADLAMAATLFGAVVFATPRDGGETGGEVSVDAWYAALLTGIAAGVKPSAAPYAIVVLVLVALRARASSATWPAAARVGGVFGASWLATAAYWYGRNLVHTGNPVYPARFLLWPGATFPQTTLREYSHHYGVARAMNDALAVYMNWPRFHGGLAVAGLVGLAAWLVARRRAMTRSQACFAGGTLVVTAVTLALLPITPYSAGNPMTFVSGFIHWDSMRYIALLPMLGWVALGFLLDAGAGAPRLRTLTAIVVTSAAVLTSVPPPVALVVLAAGVAGATLAARVRRPLPFARAAERERTGAVIAAALVLACIVVGWHGRKAATTAAALYREPLFGAAAAVLDREPPGTRVAIFGDQWVYPAFGAGDHLVPVRLDGDGRMADTPIGDAMEPGPLTVDVSRFRANLAAAGVRVVAVVHLPHPGRSPAFPDQQKALGAIADARLLHRDRAVAIWELADARAAPITPTVAPDRSVTAATGQQSTGRVR